MGASGSDGAFHEQLVESAPDALLVVDAAGVVVLANRQCESLTGWSRAELVGQPVDVLVPARLRTDHVSWRERYTAEPGRRTMGRGLELHLSVKDGHEVPVDISLSPFTHDGSPFVAVAIRDVTEQQSNTVALRSAQAELELTVTELRQQREVLQLTNELGEMLHSCRALDEAYGVLARYGAKLLPGSAGAVYRPEADTDAADLSVADGWGSPAVALAGSVAADACWALRRGRVHLRQTPDDVACPHAAESASTACIPLLAHGEVLGLVVVSLDAAGPPAAGFGHVVRSVGERVSFALANIVLRETLQRQSTHDPLTGLHNRRSLDEYLGRELARSRRAGTPVSVIAVDLDHFKTYNDTHGHAAGDAALVAVGGLMQAHVREDDLACRQGGEELLLVLPGATLEDAANRAETLRQACEQLALGPGRGITMSVGVASFPQDGTSIEAVLAAADAALYEAKSAGRNRVVSAG